MHLEVSALRISGVFLEKRKRKAFRLLTVGRGEKDAFADRFASLKKWVTREHQRCLRTQLVKYPPLCCWVDQINWM